MPGPDQISEHHQHNYVLVQRFSLLIGRALSSALQIPNAITQKTEALEQVRAASLNHNKVAAYLCSIGKAHVSQLYSIPEQIHVNNL